MKATMHFTGDPDILRLRSYFRPYCNQLYHYTNPEAANTILRNRSLQLTRGDTFTDGNEINYGIRILKDQSEAIGNEGVKKEFLKAIDSINSYLKCCYIFSMTESENSACHLRVYGNGVIQLNHSITELILDGWHSIPNQDGNSSRLEYGNDLYRKNEGLVIYDKEEQEKIAKDICIAFEKMNNKSVHVVDRYHFSDILLQFIILCKEAEEFSWEEEYRVALISKNGETKKHEKQKENEKIYIELTLAPGFANLV